MKKLALISIIYLTCSITALAQIVCPSGSQPVTFGATRNTVTDKIQPNYCVSPSGTLISKVADGGQAGQDVTAFGAKGDGKTDDTAAFQAAISAACGNKSGAVLVPRWANLMLSADVEINGVGGPACRITGGGTISWKLETPTKVNAGLTCHAVCEIDHLTFDGTNDGGPALYIQGGAHDSVIHDVTFENAENGSVFITNLFDNSDPPPTRVTFRDVTTLNNEDGPTPPIFNLQGGNGCSYLTFDNITSIGDGDYDIGDDGCSHTKITNFRSMQGTNGFGGSIQVEATSAPVTDVYIAGADVESPNFADGYSAEGVHLVSAGNSNNFVLSDVRVIGNRFYNTPGEPIAIRYVSANNATDIIVSSNWTYPATASATAIEVDGTNSLILGNALRHSGGIIQTCSTSPCAAANNMSN
ncbi:MAG TPA: glycosyl hydrolase family 28-related protein [Terriglobia bacterium]|nr:glycosyl hydrolase family 28-related protein [Terriglobia bacterium]